MTQTNPKRLARRSGAWLLAGGGLLALMACRTPAPAPETTARAQAAPGLGVASVKLDGPREITNGTSETYRVTVKLASPLGGAAPHEVDVRLEGEAGKGEDEFSGLLARGTLVVPPDATEVTALLTLSCVSVGESPANVLRGNAGDSGHGGRTCPEPQPCPQGCLPCAPNCNAPGNPPCSPGRQCCPPGCGERSCVDDPVKVTATLGALTQETDSQSVLCVP